MKLNFAILIFIPFLFLSCGQSTGTTGETNSNTSTTPVSANQATEKLPSIGIDLMQKLFDQCNYVDYLFYESDFSMSMNNKQSIQQTLSHVSEQVPTLDPNCKSIGRVFYEIDGNTEIEAEIYFSNACQYFVFIKDKKRVYANNITADGVAHFNNIFSQARKMGEQ